MKKEFVKRVLNEGIVDTKKYRYVLCEECDDKIVIKRLPIEYLNTTKAIGNWKTVHKFNDFYLTNNHVD